MIFELIVLSLQESPSFCFSHYFLSSPSLSFPLSRSPSSVGLSILLPEELRSRRPHLDEPAGQPLPLHHGGHGGQAVPFDQAAGDAGGGATLARGDDDSQAVVATPSHGPAPGVYHEADQEAVRHNARTHKRTLNLCPSLPIVERRRHILLEWGLLVLTSKGVSEKQENNHHA